MAFLARSLGLVPEAVMPTLKLIQEILLGAALVGLGFGIDMRHLFANGGRSTIAALTAWATLMLVSFGAMRFVFLN